MNMFQITRLLSSTEKYGIDYDIAESYTFLPTNDEVLQIKPADGDHLQHIFNHATKYGFRYVVLLTSDEVNLKEPFRPKLVSSAPLTWMDKTMYRINKRLVNCSKADLKAV